MSQSIQMKSTQEQRKSSQNRWEKVFKALAQVGDEESQTFTSSSSINLEALKSYLRTESSYQLEFDTGFSRHQLLHLASKLKSYADLNRDGRITLNEWNEWIEQKKPRPKKGPMQGVMQVMALSPTFSCNPPTIFVISISALQILFYLLSILEPETMGVEFQYDEVHWLTCSYFIYNPVKRREAWRFLTYMFLHGNHTHIAFNLLIQVFVGIALEMSQPGWLGSLRVAALYFAGVILGGLGASVAQPHKFLVGASAGVYALIFAHLATLILNWKEDGIIYNKRVSESHNVPMNLNPWIRGFRLAFIILFVLIDVGQIIYKVAILKEESTTSYAGHAFGSLAGVTIGVFVLQNRKVEDWELIFQWIAFAIFGLVISVFVLWHLIGTNFDYFPREVWNATCKELLLELSRPK